MASEFNCDFDAPMFVDFENLDQEANPDDFFDNAIEEERPAAPILEDVKTKEALPAKRAPRQDIDKQRHRSAIDRLAAPKSVAAPKVARSIGPLKPVNRNGINTPVDTLRPKTSAMSSLKTINKSATKPKTISKEKAAQIVERLCPSNIGQSSIKPKYVSIAEENKKFFGTPDRFRRKPRSSSADTALRGLRKRSPSPSMPANKAITALTTLTMPHSPQLLTRGRTRCNHQTGEPEKSEVKPILRKRIPSTSSKPVIKQTFTSQARLEKAKSSASSTTSNQGMSSLKQPLKIMRHNGIPIILHNKIQKKELKETATKDEKPKKPIVANPAQIKLYEMDKEIRAKKENERQKEQEKIIQAANSVKAGKDNHLKAPFMPGPSEKAPVKPLTPNFRSDIRHEERQKFDQFRKQKEAEHQAYKLQEQERREREERLESLRQRKATVHKPRPVPNLAAPPQDIQPSEKPLTVPKTPKFSIRRRRLSE